MALLEVLSLVSVIPSWAVYLTITIITICVYINMVYINNFSRRHGQVGPTPFPIFGHLPRFFRKGILQCHADWVKKYGKVVGLSYSSTRAMLVTDPELLREIMTKQSHHFINRRAFNSGTILDKHLLSLQDERWKHVRSIMSPTFTSGKLRLVSRLVNEASETFLQNLSQYAKNDQEFEAKEVFSNFTIDVITATTCGIKVDSQTDPDNPVVAKFKTLVNFSFRDPLFLLIILFPKKANLFVQLAKRIGWRNAFTDVDHIQPVIEKLIQERKLNQESGKYRDYLQILMTANREFEDAQQDQSQTKNAEEKNGMSKDEMIANILLFFLAGFDTTSQVLQFLSYLLAIHPEWQDKVIEEVDEVLQRGTPDHDNVQKLHIMEQCCCEAIRLYPPAFLIDRVASDDVTINGTFFAKDTQVFIPCWQIHHDPENYPDPDLFNPERFTPEAKQARNPYTYLPFGMGPRSCIGMRLAQMELKMLLASVLQKFRFIPCERTQVPLELDRQRPLRTVKGVWLKVVARE